MKRFMLFSLLIVFVVAGVIVYFTYPKFVKQKQNIQSNKKLFNIVMIGAAGSGKGTQSDLIKDKLNLLQISAGDVLRNFVKENPNDELTQTIKSYTDNGKLVPSEITHRLMKEKVQKDVLCARCKYNGVIFDGFPREQAQLEFLDEMLAETNNKINAVVYIDIEMEKLVERLSGRFMCAKCGEIYHKITKPTKVDGVCDKCGHTEFKVRDDDKNTDAIRQRFKIFEDQTKPLLNVYNQRGIVIKVDGSKGAKEISTELLEKLNALMNNSK